MTGSYIMFQRKLITLLIILLILQTFAIVYGYRQTLKGYVRQAVSKDTFKSAWTEITRTFKKSELPALETIERVPLKKYSVTVAPSEWRRINETLTETRDREQIPSTLTVDDQTYECTIRISRGGARHWKGRRKSVRLRFPDDKLFNGIRELNLNLPETHRVIIDPLSWEFADRMGLIVPEWDFIRLEINGRNEGVRILYEDLDAHFLSRSGLTGYIFTERARHLFPFYYKGDEDDNYPEINIHNKKDDSLEEVIWLNKALSYSDFNEMENHLRRLLDLDQVAAWQANALICGSGHQNLHNIQIFYNSAIQRMQMIPWDLAGFDHWDHKPRKTIEMELDWCNNRLLFQLNKIPEFVETRNQILWKTLQEVLPLETQLELAREMAHRIRYYLYTDDLKQASTRVFSNEDFENMQKVMHEWIQKRTEYILKELEKADLRVSTGPADPATFRASSHKTLMLSMGTGLQSGAHLEKIRISLSESPKNLNRFRLYLDTNGNGVWDAADEEVPVERRIINQKGPTLELSVDYTLLPGRQVIRDEFFDYWDKGYYHQVQPHHRYYQFLLVDHETGSEILQEGIEVEACNSVTGKPIRPEYFIRDSQYQSFWIVKSAQSTHSTKSGTPAQTPKQKTDPRRALEQIGSGDIYILPAGDYHLTETWRIPSNSVVTLSAGTRLRIAPDASIYVRGILHMSGTREKPVVLESSHPQKPWGSLIYHQTKAFSRLTHVIVRNAGMARIDKQDFTGAVSVYDGSIFAMNTHFERVRADAAIKTIRSNTRLIRCRILAPESDAIVYDSSEGEITHCQIQQSGHTAIACVNSNPKISGNLIDHPRNKGIYISERSSPVVEQNFIYGGQYGIAVRDDSNPLIRYNTICDNQRGLSFGIEKSNDFGCPTARVSRCILWGNEVEIENLCEASFILSRSVVRGGAEGDRILTEPPEFDEASHKSGLKYLLKSGSEYAIKGYGAYRGIW